MTHADARNSFRPTPLMRCVVRSRSDGRGGSGEDRRLAVTAPIPVSTWAFVAVCAMAGALAVPVDAIASPVSTFVAGLTGLLGLQL
jgi:hypothetical protein